MKYQTWDEKVESLRSERLNWKFLQHCPICFREMSRIDNTYKEFSYFRNLKRFREGVDYRYCQNFGHNIEVSMHNHQYSHPRITAPFIWVKFPKHPFIEEVDINFFSTEVRWNYSLKLPTTTFRPAKTLRFVHNVINWAEEQTTFL